MHRREMQRFNNINIIPLIDVILVLLAIVLTTTSFIEKDNLKIELPKTENTQTHILPPKQTPIYFHIDKGNLLYLKEIPQTLSHIKIQLPSLDKEQPIIIQVDKRANFGTFVGLIDALKLHALNNLTILTQAKNYSDSIQSVSDQTSE